jgi:hypothetical protein
LKPNINPVKGYTRLEDGIIDLQEDNMQLETDAALAFSWMGMARMVANVGSVSLHPITLRYSLFSSDVEIQSTDLQNYIFLLAWTKKRSTGESKLPNVRLGLRGILRSFDLKGRSNRSSSPQTG